MIEVKNLTKRYGNHKAVNDLSFRVEKGQIYGFLGPNGAGKSTTMNILTGYLAATEGTVTIDGVDVQKEPEKVKSMIGYLPEIPPLYVDMKVEEYLAFVAELKKIPAKQRKEQMEKVMEMTNITDMRKRLIKNLSKGYKQRVGLAQAILGNPKLIILDEPMVGLDPKQIIEIRDLIKELGKEHTVILSSHILSEISMVCDHIMIISKGKLVASDSPEGLQEQMSGEKDIHLAILADWTMEDRKHPELAPEKEIEEILSEVEGVLEVHYAGETAYAQGNVNGQETSQTKEGETVTKDEKPVYKYQLKVEKKVENRRELSYLLNGLHLPIIEMSMTEKSLEDIFLELTGDSATHSEGADKGELVEPDAVKESKEAAEEKTEKNSAEESSTTEENASQVSEEQKEDASC